MLRHVEEAQIKTYKVIKLWKFAFYTRRQNISIKQKESPPAWTQGAYRMPHSKCSLCCSVSWGGGVPHPMGGGHTPIQSQWGIPPSSPERVEGTPSSPKGGTPIQSLCQGDPIQPQRGYPHPVPMVGVLHPDLTGGNPIQSHWEESTPMSWPGKGAPLHWPDEGTPRGCGWTDACENITFPIFRMREVNMQNCEGLRK